jgi:hypothetical protein
MYDRFIVPTREGFAVKLDNGYFSFFKDGKPYVMRHLDFATVMPWTEAQQLTEKIFAL